MLQRADVPNKSSMCIVVSGPTKTPPCQYLYTPPPVYWEQYYLSCYHRQSYLEHVYTVQFH